MHAGDILYYIALLVLLLYSIQFISITMFNKDIKLFKNENAYIGNLEKLTILLIIWYHIIPVMRMNINIFIKLIISFIIFIIPFIMLFPILSIYNLILLLAFNNKPFLVDINNVFPENKELEENYRTKYKEELDRIYEQHNDVDCIAKNNPGFRIGMSKTPDKCWRAIYIKVLNKYKIPNFAENYPHLYKIINKPYISNAFLSILDANVDIPEHYGYFKGYLRYHLGYVIPEYKGKKPFIVCGGQKYVWKEGQGVLFDDMYNHYVKNETPYKRIVLYLDIIRPELRNDIFTNVILSLLSNNIFVQKLDKSQHKQRDLYTLEDLKWHKVL